MQEEWEAATPAAVVIPWDIAAAATELAAEAVAIEQAPVDFLGAALEAALWVAAPEVLWEVAQEAL